MLPSITQTVDLDAVTNELAYNAANSIAHSTRVEPLIDPTRRKAYSLLQILV